LTGLWYATWRPRCFSIVVICNDRSLIPFPGTLEKETTSTSPSPLFSSNNNNKNNNNKTLFHLRVRKEEEFTMLYQSKNDRGAGYPK
jgi:hypothetical protein